MKKVQITFRDNAIQFHLTAHRRTLKAFTIYPFDKFPLIDLTEKGFCQNALNDLKVANVVELDKDTLLCQTIKDNTLETIEHKKFLNHFSCFFRYLKKDSSIRLSFIHKESNKQLTFALKGNSLAVGFGSSLSVLPFDKVLNEVSKDTISYKDIKAFFKK